MSRASSCRMAGRHNVLNALAAIAIAAWPRHQRASHRRGAGRISRRRCGACKSRRIGRRPVVDDFAHHPTAIRATIEAARRRWPRPAIVGRVRAALEHHAAAGVRRRSRRGPRRSGWSRAGSGESRATALRSGAAFAGARDRTRSGGWPAGEALDSADEIAEFLAEESREGDLVLVLSNGSFDGLCDKLLAVLSTRTTAPSPHRA